MKKKILVVVLLFLFLFLLPFSMATVRAGQLPFRVLRDNFRNNSSQDNSSQDDSSQGKPWLFGRDPTFQGVLDSQQTDSTQWINLPFAGAGDEAALEWIRGQIDTVLDKLQQQEGINLPGDMEQKLNNFFAVVHSYLKQSQRQSSSLNLPKLLKGPDYNLTCNYDPKTQVMEFIADRVLSSDNGLTSIDLNGSFNPDGPWDMAFLVVNSISNRDRANQRKTYFQRALASLSSSSAGTSSPGSSSASQEDNSKDSQEPADNSPWKANHSSKFIFSGQISQDGLVSLYLNPCQTINVRLMNNTAYSTKSGIEVLQDAGSREGKFYLDILDNSISGADDNVLYHWEKPLW